MRIKVLVILLIFIINPFVTSQSVSGSDQQDDPIFLINDGILRYYVSESVKLEAVANNGIEEYLSIIAHERVNVTSISDKTVQFDHQFCHFTPNSYQIKDGVKYQQSSWGLRFYDDDDLLIVSNDGTSDYKSDYGIKSTANKEAGNIETVVFPFGSSSVKIASYYSSTNVQSFLERDSFALRTFLDYSNSIFNPNVRHWKIGDVVGSPSDDVDFIVSEQSSDTSIIVENEGIPEGISTYLYQARFHKRSGLLLSEEYSYTMDGITTMSFERSLQKEHIVENGNLVVLSSGFELIDDGYPQVTAPEGKTVDSPEKVELAFNVSELFFYEYNFYKNNTLIETGNDSRSNWVFEVQPTAGKTTWRLEITDQLGYTGAASTWLIAEPAPITTDQTSISSESSKSSTDDSLIFPISSLFVVLPLLLVKRKLSISD
ncbi:MAG: hypothetical protein ACXAD7_18215 [Candidatus Kariarchaeaceae archaeon]|jgi:hypothetical protein